MAVLENLRLLKDDLVRIGWPMTLFEFTYNKHDYFAVIIRYQKDEIKPQYALVKLNFHRKTDLKDTFYTWANTVKIEIPDIKKFREYFYIEYAPNIGDILKQFTDFFATKVPQKINLNANEKDALVRILSISDSEDPNKKYCFALRRNPIINGKQTKRSIYNDQKATILKPQLYDMLLKNSDDMTISFCFSANPMDEQDDITILNNFVRRKIIK